MNGKERMTAALAGRCADRVPMQILAYDGYIARCAGRAQWEFDYGTSEEQVAMQLAALRRHPLSDGCWVWAGTNRGPLAGVRIEYLDGGPHAVFEDGTQKALRDDPADGLWNRSPEEMRRRHELMRVRSAADIDEKLGPVASAEELLAGLNYVNLRALSALVGEQTFLWFNHSSLFASAAGYLGGIEELLVQTLTDPALVEAVLDRILAQHLEHIEAGARAGGHGVWHCFMHEGTDMLNPETWRRMVKPRAAALVARAHARGLRHVAWFLNDCRALLPDLLEIGIDGLATEQPRAAYHAEPGDLRRLAGQAKLCLFGWLWESDLLAGDRAAIRATLDKQYREAREPFVVNTPGLTQEFAPEVMDMVLEFRERHAE